MTLCSVAFSYLFLTKVARAKKNCLIRIVEAVLDEDGALLDGVCSCVCETVREGCRELVKDNKVKQ